MGIGVLYIIGCYQEFKFKLDDLHGTYVSFLWCCIKQQHL